MTCLHFNAIVHNNSARTKQKKNEKKKQRTYESTNGYVRTSVWYNIVSPC